MLAIAHLLDDGFHVAQIALKRTLARGSQLIFRFWEPVLEGFRHGNISGIFQFACVHAQVTVRRIHEAFEIIEGQ